MEFEQHHRIIALAVAKNLPWWRRTAFCFMLVVLGALNSVRSSAAQPDELPLKPFRFVQLCDTQLGFGAVGYEADLKSFQQAVRQINQLKPDLVVICGDLVNVPESRAFADFKEVCAEFNVPYHCAAGNHDLGHPVKPLLLASYRETIGKDYYQFMHHGYTFVVVNTQLWKSPLEPETARHDAWLAQTLREAEKQNSPVFVVGHHPLFLQSADENEQYFNIPPERRKRILELFVENGVIAMLTGHTHKLVSNTHQAIQFLSGETTSKNFDKRPLGFRLWIVDSPKRISHQFVALETPAESVSE